MIIREEELGNIPDRAYKPISYVFERNLVSDDGLWLEFGVFTGASINRIATWNPQHKVYGFDSFEGLPEHWEGRTDHVMGKGTFNLGGNMPPVLENVELIKGWYQDSVPKFFSEHPEPISFMHIDSDIYSSAKIILNAAVPQIKNGCIIVFDEMVEYPGFHLHEWKAWWEFVDATNITFEWIAGNRSRRWQGPPREGKVFEFDRPSPRHISPAWENVALRIANNPLFKE